ncbi:MAG: nucleotidyltransferase domain-containing protein [Bacteroidetes bacterium]|nr:nucleotidyltransferase domain-containing protein [Bacteroidota bacterium]
MMVIESNIESIRKLCNTHYVETMYVFGSSINANFNDESDVDFLVKFKDIELENYFDNYMDFKLKLESLVGRKVDLLEEQTLKNPILIQSINRSKERVYG